MVICTAFSDHSWQDIQRVLGTSDKLLILKKPFDKVEVQQLAVALTEKWNLRRLARLHSDGLADLVRTRTSDLARCYEAKNELMARASQESMRLMERLVETAESFGGTTSNEQQRKSTSDLQDLSKRLLSHLGDVITFHTIEAGKLQIESREYNLRALCQSAVEGCSVRARARGLRVTLTVEDTLPAQVYGCAEQVLHVLALLIDEAIERGVAGGGDITVSVKRAVRVNTLEFEITGTVLSANQIVTLNFTQEARECSTASDQLSLGFAVAGKLVETLGGSIERQSKAGQASISRFTLPLETQPKRLGSDQREPRAYPGR
jgi:signal transduction histidine kinase